MTGVAAAVLLAGGWWWSSARRQPAPATDSQRAPASARPPVFTRTPSAAEAESSGERPPSAGPKPEAVFEALPPGTRVPEGNAGDPFLQLYGGRSGRLPAGRTPMLAEPRAETSSSAQRPELLVWLPSLRADARGTTISARLRAGDGTLTVTSAELAIAVGDPRAAPARFSPMRTVQQRSSSDRDDRGDGEQRTENAQFTASFTPPDSATDADDSAAPTPVRYLVRARGKLDGTDFERSAGGIFYVHRPGGRLLVEAAKLAPRDGDLRMEVPAVIDRAGTYFVYAELWGGPGGGSPIAFARERLPALPAGKRQLSLLFGGKILLASGIDGPYVVRNVRFQQVDTHPPHESDPVPALPPTPPRAASSFH